MTHSGRTTTLGNAAAAGMRLIVSCRGCGHEVEFDPGEVALRHGAGTLILDWFDRLVCSDCGSGQLDMVISGP
jgi:hypothetical protein